MRQGRGINPGTAVTDSNREVLLAWKDHVADRGKEGEIIIGGQTVREVPE